MGRDRIYQPMTTNVGDLAIGIMKVSIGAAQDAAVPGSGTVTTLGSLKDATLSMKPTFKEHKTAYPQILDFKIADLLSANYKVGVEEIGAATTIQLLGEALDTLNTGTPHYHSVDAISEFATGGTLRMFTPYAQLKPTLNLNFGEDFASIPFEFEALTKPEYTRKDLVYRSRLAAGTRSLDNQAVTQNVENLGIGMFQVRIGALVYNEPTGIFDNTPVASSGGLVAINAAILAATTAYNAEPPGPAKVALKAAMDAAIALGPMTEVHSIGAIKNADLQTNPTFKEHFSGFPKVKDLIMLESSTITVSTALEQISAEVAASALAAVTSATSLKGAATKPFDALFDGSVNGSLYYAPVEITCNLVTGGVLSFWLPNCQIVPEADYAPGNDWASMPFKLEAQIQFDKTIPAAPVLVNRVFMNYTADPAVTAPWA